MKYAAYYAKEPTFMEDADLIIGDLANTHVRVRELEADSLENAYMLSQGEMWSPNGEARGLIQSLGLHHTSMSVGDVLVTLNGKGESVRYYQVANTGFKEVPETAPPPEEPLSPLEAADEVRKMYLKRFDEVWAIIIKQNPRLNVPLFRNRAQTCFEEGLRFGFEIISQKGEV